MFDGPKIEDFGITEDDLSRAPTVFLSRHRIGICCWAYIVASVVLFVLIYQASGSLPAAAFFTVITLAAGSVLLLPLLLVALCVGERAQERWICSRLPVLRACIAYRAAVADHQQREVREHWTERDARWWALQERPVFMEKIAMALSTHGSVERCEGDREVCGFDYLVRSGDHTTLVRCETDSEPVGASVGREMTAALTDCSADSALIVTRAGATAFLKSYVAGRPITIVAPWEIGTGFRNSVS